jgi:hypothetical protein
MTNYTMRPLIVSGVHMNYQMYGGLLSSLLIILPPSVSSARFLGLQRTRNNLKRH